MDITFYILISLYNTEQYVTRCVNSILSQKYKIFRVVIVNDGSTDNSYSVCSDLIKNDDRFTIIDQKNKGTLLARERALSEIKNVPRDSDYILFVDSDDYVVPEYLETLHNYLSDDNEYDILAFNFYKETRKKRTVINIFNKTTKLSIEEFFREIIKNYEMNNIWSKAFRYSLFKKHELKPTYIKIIKGNDSYRLLPLVYEASKILYINEALYMYFHNEKGLTNAPKIGALDSILFVRSEKYKYMKKMNMISNKDKNMFFDTYKSSLGFLIYHFWSLENKEKLLTIKEHDCYKEMKKYKKITIIKKPYYKILFLLFDNGYYGLLSLFRACLKNGVKLWSKKT
ncbi:MAG: glycosyltransferase family 2 protein [Chitinispirillales bacterium]|jgi:glycosyltransferase involved in cell wall biosynthesis|nr:glycosyltransferase family 2 protein [Chitinispirillales bacterium]